LPIITVSGAVLSAASVANIRSKTPARLQRMRRLYKVLCGPSTAGASRHINPPRMTRMMPLMNRRIDPRHASRLVRQQWLQWLQWLQARELRIG
jgi:hypothetical protein